MFENVREILAAAWQRNASLLGIDELVHMPAAERDTQRPSPTETPRRSH